ncbi:MAG TPA: hypothetical protein VJR47_23100 [Stellaceae bacterium]|nr:hypothetical protein [Stellaceae bacterium]
MAEDFRECGSAVRVVTTPIEVLIDECNRHSETCGYTATTFTIFLRWLRGWRIASQVIPVIFGAFATWKIVAQASPAWAAVAAFLATVIPPVYAATKTDDGIKDYAKAAGEFTNLRDRFRNTAVFSSLKPLPEFEAEFEALRNRLEKLRECPLTPPEWFFKLARRKHQVGHYHYDYDVAKNGSAKA